MRIILNMTAKIYSLCFASIVFFILSVNFDFNFSLYTARKIFVFLLIVFFILNVPYWFMAGYIASFIVPIVVVNESTT
jgi:hypothetical protein